MLVAFEAPANEQASSNNNHQKTAQLECALQLPKGPLCRLYACFPLISIVTRWKSGHTNVFESQSVAVHTGVVSVEGQLFECRAWLRALMTGALCVKNSSHGQHVHIVYQPGPLTRS